MYSRAHVIFKGKVQGVFFRANTERKAVELYIAGWVRNREDSSVEAVFEGPKHKIQELIRFCETGQMYAKVEDLNVSWEEYQNEFDDFEIRY
jgi:acylphosphatase